MTKLNNSSEKKKRSPWKIVRAWLIIINVEKKKWKKKPLKIVRAWAIIIIKKKKEREEFGMNGISGMYKKNVKSKGPKSNFWPGGHLKILQFKLSPKKIIIWAQTSFQKLPASM